MTTFFVRQSGGSDANDGLTFANGWATLQKAADTAVAGDEVRVASDGTYLPGITTEFDINAGTPRNPIKFRGAGPLGEDDGSVVTFDGSTVSPLGAIVRIGAAASPHIAANIWFEGFRFTGGANRNIWIENDQRGILFDRCRIDNAVQDGLIFNEPNAFCSFVDCQFDNNGGDGISSQSGGPNGRVFAINCAFHDNTGDGINDAISISLQQCWVYKNGGHGVFSVEVNPDIQIANCVFDANTGDGLRLRSITVSGDRGLLLIQNNLITNNGGWGISFEGDPCEGLIGNNLYFNNTSGEVSIDGTTEDTFADFDTMGTSIDADPQYLDTGNGTEDYRVAAGSPALEAGYPPTLQPLGAINFSHIGSNVPEAASGVGIIGG